MRPCLFMLTLLMASTAAAQNAVLIQLPNGTYIGIATAADGTQIVITNVTIIKLPNPTPPPAKAAKAVLLMESGEQDQEAAILIAGIRNNPKVSKVVAILDPDTEDQFGNPSKVVVAAKKLIGNAKLPCLIGFSPTGNAVVFVEIKGLADVTTALKKWGL